jgi:hypothetical protein
MSTKSYTLIPYHLQDHNVQSWEKKDFFLELEGTTKFWGQKTHYLEQIWIEGLQILVPR